MSNWNYYLPTRIIFGDGVLEQLASQARSLGQKAFLVTGRKAMREQGITAQVTRALEENNVQVQVFERVEANPSIGTIEAAAQEAIDFGADLFIGLGGGSALDSAKGIAAVATTGRGLWDLILNPVFLPLPPIIAIPTTSGTGSEVTPYSVFTNPEKKVKKALYSSNTYPVLALIDPRLTYSATPYLTAVTGSDALAHAVESYLGTESHPVADAFAEEAVRLVSKYLVAACEGGSPASRSAMAKASLLAGIALGQVGTVMGHGIGQALGGLFGIDHGAAVGLLLPEVIRFNQPVRAKKCERLARILAGPEQKAGDPALQVEQLLARLPLDKQLRSYGVNAQQSERIIQESLAQAPIKRNPRPVTGEDIMKIVNKLM